MTRQQIHHNVYLFGLFFLAASLPLSIYTTSLAEILLILNWLAEGKFRNKFRTVIKRPAVLFIISLYLLHLTGLIYTENFNYALHDLQIKLPILLLPLIFVTSPSLSEKMLKNILMVFSMAVIVSISISILIFYDIIPYEYYDFREISIFISHIRLSLMVNLTIFILLYYLFHKDADLQIHRFWKIPAIMAIVLAGFFLLILKSFTGIIILIAVSLILGWYIAGRIRQKIPRVMVRVVVISFPLLIASYLYGSIEQYFDREDIDFNKLEITSPGGHEYFHDTTRHAVENGHYVWIYISEKELRNSWNQRSTIPYDSIDNKGQWIKYTLIRYLSSKGLRKDADGIAALSEEDVKAIENGIANHIFLDRYSFYPRIYQVVWEIDGYFRGGDPSGHSITQRIAYMKAARAIIGTHWLIGIGTGDVQQEFDHYYNQIDSKLNPNNRRRAHNQFVTFLLTFGVIGFIITMMAIFVPVFLENKWNDYLFVVFFVIGLLSMLNEDTLETQTGVSFFIFFYCLFLFARQKNNRKKKGQIQNIQLPE